MNFNRIDKLPEDARLRDPKELELLISAINDRLEIISDNFQATGGGTGYNPAQRTVESGAVAPLNPWTYTSNYVDVRSFLDPLQIELRLANLRVQQAMMAANAVGQEQLQVDSVVARHIQVLTITGDKLAFRTVTADKMNVNELSAIVANLGTITAGNITLDSAGFIRTGLTGYNTGTGMWVGYNTGYYKFFLGDAAGGRILWDGVNLTISGGYTGTIGWSSITGSGKPADNATVGATWGTNVYSRPLELTDGRITTALSAAGLVVSGVKPGIVVSTGGVAGLYLGSDFLGYYNGSNWMTYMDNSGRFYLGGTSGALRWDGTNLTITGGYTGTVGWTSVSSKPVELTDGRITTALSAAGLVVSGVKPGIVVSTGGVSGLYLGSDFLGYFDGTNWKTYMDNTGKFYLGGTSGSLRWDGSSLVVSGTINATAGYFGTSSAVVAIGAGGLTIGASGTITSSNYVANTSGLSISTSTAEFNNIVARGTIYASTGYFGTSSSTVAISSGGLTVGASGAISTSNYVAGVSGVTITTSTSEFNNVTVRGTVYATAGTFSGSVDISSGVTRTLINSSGMYLGDGTTNGSIDLRPSGLNARFILGYAGNDLVTISSSFTVPYFSGYIRLDNTNGTYGTYGPVSLYWYDVGIYRSSSGVIRTSGASIVDGNVTININYGELRFTYGGSTVVKIYESGGLNLYGDSTHPVIVNNTDLVVGKIKKSTSDGYSTILYDGDNNLSFSWSTYFKLKVDSTEFLVPVAGGYTATSDTPVTGYVEMYDSSGTTRKFAIVSP